MNPPQVYMRVEGGGFRMRNTCMPLPLSRDLPRSRTEPESLAFPALAGENLYHCN